MAKEKDQILGAVTPVDGGELPDFNAFGVDRSGGTISPAPIYYEQNITNWVSIGKAFVLGKYLPIPAQLGSFTTTYAGAAYVLGYGNGCMLATATGKIAAGTASALTAGVIYNFDPSSTDTGQKVWNGMVIADQDLYGYVGPDTTLTNVRVAAPLNGWTLLQKFLYGPCNPTVDAAAVTTAITAPVGFNLSRSIVQLSDQSYQPIFSI